VAGVARPTFLFLAAGNLNGLEPRHDAARPDLPGLRARGSRWLWCRTS